MTPNEFYLWIKDFLNEPVKSPSMLAEFGSTSDNGADKLLEIQEVLKQVEIPEPQQPIEYTTTDDPRYYYVHDKLYNPAETGIINQYTRAMKVEAVQYILNNPNILGRLTYDRIMDFIK